MCFVYVLCAVNRLTRLYPTSTKVFVALACVLLWCRDERRQYNAKSAFRRWKCFDLERGLAWCVYYVHNVHRYTPNLLLSSRLVALWIILFSFGRPLNRRDELCSPCRMWLKLFWLVLWPQARTLIICIHYQPFFLRPPKNSIWAVKLKLGVAFDVW